MTSPDYNTWLGIHKIASDNGVYSAELELAAEHKNSLGWIHGGVYASLLDTVMGNAVLSLKNQYGWNWGATANLTIQFQAPACSDKLIGTGTVTKVGKHLVFVTGKIRDSDERVLCRAQGTWFVDQKKASV